MSKPTYDTSLARMAGNIASGMMHNYSAVLRVLHDRDDDEAVNLAAVRLIACGSVELARAIVDEVKRTEPAAQQDDK